MTVNEHRLVFAQGLISDASRELNHAIDMMMELNTDKIIQGAENASASLQDVIDRLEKVKREMWNMIYPMVDYGPEEEKRLRNESNNRLNLVESEVK